ncbi:TetR family transcriptional regulator C-terminal domain-containing protein [Curtobacterium sp. VKM Ac-2922]|uniref:TetR family transcriptional regulator C-terminal domain-containing protein n=1 Tax=Curtobacterium sp. VKM Ac-2922 TaxID=2929475 RepID=UPI001FB4F24F|nr:TetR family transcriptional regulator C-terminal domain-containing protein [Curtobacterium sp. VKM Ac-2922]MCJ1715185.1 TetR family transcriptional regulator C-terminal domain-containing protein [Curtobacterium sp. VKM Ac-2922]
MPTPPRRRLSPEERSAQIDAAAVALARADGLAGLTLRTVAASVGVAPSLVAHYRPAIKALVADTFRTVATDEVAEVRQVVIAEHDPVDRLRALLAAVNDPRRDDVGTIWADAWSIGRSNPQLADAARAVMGAWQELASQVVADGVAAGSMHTDDPDRVAFLLFALVDAANGYALVGHRSRAERDDLVVRTVAGAVGLPAERLTSDG